MLLFMKFCFKAFGQLYFALMPGSDSIWDSFDIDHKNRWKGVVPLWSPHWPIQMR